MCLIKKREQKETDGGAALFSCCATIKKDDGQTAKSQGERQYGFYVSTHLDISSLILSNITHFHVHSKHYAAYIYIFSHNK